VAAVAEYRITYDEMRTWARWLNCFTEEEIADALGEVPVELGRQACAALLYHGIIQETGVEIDGRDGGTVKLYEYVPLPPGPKVHATLEPPEVVVPREFGGDPLRVERGLPVGLRDGTRRWSRTGQRRPGRTQGPGKAKTT
jgi:hypothetical protein